MTGRSFPVILFALFAAVAAVSWTGRLRLDDGLLLGIAMGGPVSAGFTFVMCALASRIGTALGVPVPARSKSVHWREVFAAAVFALSLALFGLSLVFPSFHTGPERQWYGGELFGVGYVGLVVLQFGWYANPCLFAAYYFAWRAQYHFAAVLGLLSVLLASSSRLMTTISEYASGTGTISGWHAGFDLWLASCIAAFVGFALAGLRRRPNNGLHRTAVSRNEG